MNLFYSGPLYRFGPQGPPALQGLPMASYATDNNHNNAGMMQSLITYMEYGKPKWALVDGGGESKWQKIELLEVCW